jgi:hypothetical protein
MIIPDPNDVLDAGAFFKVFSIIWMIVLLIYGFYRGWLGFEWFKRDAGILERYPQAALENNLTFKEVVSVKQNGKIEQKIINSLLPVKNHNVDYIDLVSHGWSVTDVENIRENLEGSMDLEITGVENPMINHQQKKGIIRLWYSEKGLPHKILYKNAPQKAGYINFGKSAKGWVIVPINRIYHFLVYAMTRKGKSVMIGSMLSQIFLDERSTALFIDFKSGETALQYKDCNNIAICTNINDVQKIESYRMTIRALEAVTEIMGKRHSAGAVARSKGKRKYFEPIWVILDEASFFFEGWKAPKAYLQKTCIKHMVAIAQMGGSANVHLIIGTQKPSLESLPDMLRSNIQDVIGGKTGDGNTSKLLMETEVLYRMNGRAGYMCKKDESGSKIFMQTLFVDMEKGEGGRIIKSYGKRKLTNEYEFIQYAIDNPKKWLERKKKLKKQKPVKMLAI